MDLETLKAYKNFVLYVTGKPDDEDFLLIRDCDIKAINSSLSSLDELGFKYPLSQIISIRFGLDGEGTRTFQQIASCFNITRSRAQQLFKKSMRFLRHPKRRFRFDMLFRSNLEDEIEKLWEKNHRLEMKLSEATTKAIEAEGEANFKIKFGYKKLDQIGIDKLLISIRLYNCLRKAEIANLAQIVAHTENDFLRMKNFGRRSLHELKELLSEIGLLLKRG